MEQKNGSIQKMNHIVLNTRMETNFGTKMICCIELMAPQLNGQMEQKNGTKMENGIALTDRRLNGTMETKTGTKMVCYIVLNTRTEPNFGSKMKNKIYISKNAHQQFGVHRLVYIKKQKEKQFQKKLKLN